MLTRIGLISALSSLLIAAPALANRAGDAPIKAPRTLQTNHIAFTLPGGPWLQLVGQLARTPSLGNYLAGGNGVAAACSTWAEVSGKQVQRRPVVKGRTVRVSNARVLRVTSAARHGAVQWWTGTMKESAASALGVQRLPARLATSGKPYLLYTVTIRSSPSRKDAARCAPIAATVATTIARTMHIASGPPVARAPFGN